MLTHPVKRRWSCVAGGILCGLCAPGGASAAVVFSDGTFADVDWSAQIVVSSVGASFTAGQVATGGNPGSYRTITHTIPGIGSINVGHFLAGAAYAPSTTPIASLTFTYDLIASLRTAAYHPLIKQGNSYYFGTVTDAANTANWRHVGVTQNNLTPSGFTLLAGPGPALPDFSAAGLPIEFGFLSANSNTVATPQVTTTGIDNWTVTINQVPEPGGVGLAGAAVAGGMLARRRRGQR